MEQLRRTRDALSELREEESLDESAVVAALLRWLSAAVPAPSVPAVAR